MFYFFFFCVWLLECQWHHQRIHHPGVSLEGVRVLEHRQSSIPGTENTKATLHFYLTPRQPPQQPPRQPPRQHQPECSISLSPSPRKPTRPWPGLVWVSLWLGMFTIIIIMSSSLLHICKVYITLGITVKIILYFFCKSNGYFLWSIAPRPVFIHLVGVLSQETHHCIQFPYTPFSHVNICIQ